MYYPRSLVKFILFGFVVVSAPLVFAMFKLSAALNDLSQQSRESVFDAVKAVQLSRHFYDDAVWLSRFAARHMILEDDPSELKAYNEKKERLTATRAELMLIVSKDEDEVLRKAMEEEARSYQLLQRYQSQSGSAAQNEINAGYTRFEEYALAVHQKVVPIAHASAEELQKTAHSARRQSQVLWWSALVIAVSLAVWLTFLIARPIRQIDLAIRQLGAADFTKEIEVQGTSDLRYLGQRLDWLRARLQTLEEQQTKFLRNLSHELKTPLTAIREGTELLRDGIGGNLKDEQKEILHIVRENALSLQRMIEDLLQYHQTRVMEPNVRLPVDLGEIVHHVVREHRLAAWARLVSFEERLLPLLVMGNARKITTIIDNLVSNATKYSPRLGKINILMGVDKDCARLEIIDEGPGIPESERERIFEMFFQGAPPSENRVKSSGLGLAIVKEYVQAHDGRITVKSRSDGRQGARFVLWLPFWSSTVPLGNKKKATDQGTSQ